MTAIAVTTMTLNNYGIFCQTCKVETALGRGHRCVYGGCAATLAFSVWQKEKRIE